MAYATAATNLAAGDTGSVTDIFVTNVLTGVTTAESRRPNGTETDDFSELPKLSSDGSRVEFRSQGSNLVAGDTNNAADVFVRDRISGRTQRVSTNADRRRPTTRRSTAR